MWARPPGPTRCARSGGRGAESRERTASLALLLQIASEVVGARNDIERDGLVVRVPWGATLAEVRAGIETVVAAVEPTWAPS